MIALFKLLGLNKYNDRGVYATVECGKEDWFHSDIDHEALSVADQYELFDKMKNSDDTTFKGSTVLVEFDHYTNEVPINPVIKEINIPSLKQLSEK